ncbi:MAG: hypothetical protein KatS3mg060_2107 [Dehalococcoidia bacterium]|nr:MAG: hypothetical protein KatS3mg060_2107 [Dehalococcoidia bacterium]
MRTPGCLVGATAFFGLGALALVFLALDWFGVLPAVVGASAGVILLIAACSIPVVILLRQDDRSTADYRRVLMSGPRLRATVTALRPEPAGTVVVAEGANPITGAACTFISPPLAASDSPLAIGGEVAIAIDPANPARGIMDLDSSHHAPAGWTQCLSSDSPNARSGT